MTTKRRPTRIRFNRLDTAPTVLARLLYAKRADENLSLIEAAKEAGIPRTTFHRLETLPTPPSVGTLVKVAKWLNCDPGDLVP